MECIMNHSFGSSEQQRGVYRNFNGGVLYPTYAVHPQPSILENLGF